MRAVLVSITLSLAAIGGIWGNAACAGGRRGHWPLMTRRCPEPEAFAPSTLEAWDGARLDVGLVPRAPASCPGAHHPVLRASHPKAAAWVHIVEAAGRTFVDVSKADAVAGVPFYTQSREFWDNPGWGRPDTPLMWTGWAFPVAVDGTRVTPLGGLRWGFRWRPEDAQPEPLAVTAAARADWTRLRPALSGFTRYAFSD